MTKQPSQQITITLSAELARPDDDPRRQTAQRWQVALHRLCLLRATLSDTSYESEWAVIFDRQRLLDDLRQGSKLLALAAVEVLEVQHEHGLMVCDAEKISYDAAVSDEMFELITAMRIKIEHGLP
jgi:hypothetical protein